ncbi:hypothetical protein Hte_001575 [Hypoxylon texense]
MSNVINQVWSGSVNGNKEARGTKRKAKGDPYELPNDDIDDIDDDDPIPNATPSIQRPRSRISEVSNPSAKGRPSNASKASKRRSRSSGIQRVGPAEGSRADANANLARAREPQAARLQPQPDGEHSQSSLVPVADMGIPEPAKESNATENAQDPVDDNVAESANKHAAKREAKGKAKATKVGEEEEKQNEADDEAEEQEVEALLEHRMAKDDNSRVEVLVRWAKEDEEDSWEAEEEIQKGAGETLYAYWKKQGGRTNALFIKPKNPPAEVYHVYNILAHERRTRGGFEFEVQWVGHPPTRGETTMEAEPKLRKIAPEALDEYWESVGGRDKFLAKRGRNKKARAD